MNPESGLHTAKSTAAHGSEQKSLDRLDNADGRNHRSSRAEHEVSSPIGEHLVKPSQFIVFW
jgi:hypothetical protein